MRRLGIFLASGLGLGLVFGGTAAARDLFEGSFTSTNPITGVTQSASAGRNNLLDFADLFTNAGLQSTLPGYTPISAAIASVSLRGVPATLSYAANSPVLRLQIPSINVDVSFNGATRDESQDLAVKWVQGEGGPALTRFLQQAVATTPVDPVAGNPNSLMSQMGASDFGAALGLGGGRPGGLGLAARFGSYAVDGFNSRVYSLPISTSFDLGEGRALLLDGPLTFIDTEGAQSYSGSVGVGMRLPIRIGLPETLDWTLTPMVRMGGVGSLDLGAVGGLWSVSVTSSLGWQVLPGTRLQMANMASRLQTLPIDYGGYNVSYELTNMMYRNGLLVTQDIGELFGRAAQATVFAIDTRFTGDALYVNSYQEYGGYLTFGGATPISVGLTVLTGERGYGGVTVNLGSVF